MKVQFVRNIINDDHFDLTDKRKLLGKALAYFSRNANKSEVISLQVDSHPIRISPVIIVLDSWEYSLQKIRSSLRCFTNYSQQ